MRRKAPYVSIGRPGIYGTMGGIIVDESFRVLREDGSFIPGLYAATETICRNYGGDLGLAAINGYEAGNALEAELSAE